MSESLQHFPSLSNWNPTPRSETRPSMAPPRSSLQEDPGAMSVDVSWSGAKKHLEESDYSNG